jgi:hypothetical protein
MEATMALSEDDVIAELAALRIAVKKLVKVANLGSVRPGEFGKNALKEGLADLVDVSQWDFPDERKPRFREEAEERYRGLFKEE